MLHIFGLDMTEACFSEESILVGKELHQTDWKHGVGRHHKMSALDPLSTQPSRNLITVQHKNTIPEASTPDLVGDGGGEVKGKCRHKAGGKDFRNVNKAGKRLL